MVRMRKKSLWLKSGSLGLALLWSLAACADTKMTAEGGAIRIVSYAVRDYQLSHGRFPTNWDQLAEFRDIDDINRGTYPIKEHYVFIASSRIPLPDSEKGDVLLIRTSPATNNPTGEMGRYIVSRSGSDFIVNWLTEDKVQKMLADAGLTELPKVEVSRPPNVSHPGQGPLTIKGPDGESSKTTHQDLPNSRESKSAPTKASDFVPQTVATAAPGNRTSWLGLTVVLGMGLLFSIFLLFRTKQK